MRFNIRLLHAYLGATIAPSVLLFCLTGGLQLLSLHEAHGNYQPSAFVQRLSRVHVDQVFKLKAAKPAPPAAPKAVALNSGPVSEPRRGISIAVIALKLYFLMVAIVLAISTGLGLWIAWSRARQRVAFGLLFVLGIAIPLLLVGLG